MLAGLAGLVVYIKLEEKANVEVVDRTMQNSLAHNGDFLESMYPSRGKNREQQGYVKRKERVKTLMKAFKNEAAAKSEDVATDMKTGESRLLDALTEQRIRVHDQKSKETALLEELNKVVSG